MNIEDYPLAIMPFDTVAFDKMNKQAQQYFDWFVNLIPMRIDRLREFYKQDNGSAEVLDFCPHSLIHLWKWAMPHATLVPLTDEELGELKNTVPARLWDFVTKKTLHQGAMAMVIDIAVYMAEVYQRDFQG